jgi:hypothetical protein
VPNVTPSLPQHGRVRLDLDDKQWNEIGQGQLIGPDTRRYSRRTTRTKRREADGLIADGAPLVLYYWAGDQLAWFDGADAQEQWQAVRPDVTSEEPRRRGDIEWTAGRWEDEDGRPLLLLTGHC